MDPTTAFTQVTPKSEGPTPSTASHILLRRENPKCWNIYFDRVLEYPEWADPSSNPETKITLAPTKSNVIYKSTLVNGAFQCTICKKYSSKLTDDLATHMKQCTADKKC